MEIGLCWNSFRSFDGKRVIGCLLGYWLSFGLFIVFWVIGLSFGLLGCLFGVVGCLLGCWLSIGFLVVFWVVGCLLGCW